MARCGTLSGAAESLKIGIATLSRRLDRLEGALGVPLFTRHQTGYRLTDDGEALLERAERLEQAGLAFGDTSGAESGVTGRVRGDGGKPRQPADRALAWRAVCSTSGAAG